MPYAAFLATVRDRGGYDAGGAEEVTGAVISTLGQRLAPQTAEHLADQLPDPMGELLADAPARAHDWGVTEFCAQVAETLGVEEQAAHGHARVVLGAVAEQISGGELNTLMGSLPAGYAALFGRPELSG